MEKPINAFLAVATLLIFLGCASPRQAETDSRLALTVARILAADATFALVLNQEAAILGQYLAPNAADLAGRLSSLGPSTHQEW